MDDPNLKYESYNKKTKKNTWLIPLLLGIMIGILIMNEVVPRFVDDAQGENPLQNELEKNRDMNDVSIIEQNSSPSVTNHVQVDIHTRITEIVEEVSPAVVGVTNIQVQRDFWQQQEENGYNEAGTGSGVIYKLDDTSAYVVTNQHVIEGADSVEVILHDDTSIEAEILGSDIFSDLAVLKMDATHVERTMEMGSSDMLKVGEPAIAIGNPLGHMFAGSVTQGVISGTQRTIPIDLDMDGRADWQAEVIQTDAAINPGNSGGALINIEGQLIGINSMKINQTAVEGIGFAIPIDFARPIIHELEQTGQVTRPYLGVEIYTLDEVPTIEWKRTLNLPDDIEGGVYIWSIDPFSPADRGGLQRLDVITALDGQQIMGTIDLRKILYEEKQVNDDLEVTYYRDGEKHTTTITLVEQR